MMRRPPPEAIRRLSILFGALTVAIAAIALEIICRPDDLSLIARYIIVPIIFISALNVFLKTIAIRP